MSQQDLAEYLVALACNSTARAEFLADGAASAGANLSEDEHDMLDGGHLATILKYIEGTGPRPTPPERDPVGTETGGGG